ncbi:MAG TPA: AAA family ATPase [Gammaproteobacteria bacterium]|nr:AAA family ATPase [Gammaproteobacteria bacterium]
MNARFGRGLVLGKFYPPHAGHSYLITRARAQCDRLTVMVLAAHVESIPLEARREWLAELHPDCEIVAGYDDVRMDLEDAGIWARHMEAIVALLDARVDAVFTSEPYGDELATRLGAVHVSVDPLRRAVPCSGAAVCADPERYWWALAPPVRAWFARRVVVVGAESTGTTTLAAALAHHYTTEWLPEVGREWSASRPGGLAAPWRSEEFDEIARRQAASEDDAARKLSHPLLFCDTDALATAIWHERYMGRRSTSIEAFAAGRVPDLYLLTLDDIPFVQDGLRDGEHLRAWMTQRFREVLAGQPAPVIEVAGPQEARMRAATGAVDGLIGRGWSLHPPL